GLGLAHSVHAFAVAPRNLVLRENAAAGITTFRAAQEHRKDLESADSRQLWQRGQMEAVLHGPLRGSRGAGRRMVYRTVLRLALSSDGAEGSAHDFLCMRGDRAAARRAVLRVLRKSL